MTDYEKKQAEISEVYNRNLNKYKDLEAEVKHIIYQKLQSEQIKVHTVTSRIKQLDSLLTKIEDKEYDDPFKEVNDLVGVRIVCLFLSDIEEVNKHLRSSFEILEEDNKIDGINSNTFGYMSIHFIGKLKGHYAGPRYDHIKDMIFEIQVRTISMDAWANISHYLDYKSITDIPHNLKKDFNALSALFYIADSHFEMFVKSSRESQVENEKTVKEMLEDVGSKRDVEINFDTLSAYIHQKFNDRKPARSNETVSKVVNSLIEAGYRKLSEIDEVIEKTETALLRYEEKYYPNATEDKKYNAIGILRAAFWIYDEKFRELDAHPSLKQRVYDSEIQALVNR